MKVFRRKNIENIIKVGSFTIDRDLSKAEYDDITKKHPGVVDLLEEVELAETKAITEVKPSKEKV